MMLTVYIDFKSPAAYLALNPTLDLAERLALTIDWRPFKTIERDVPKLGKEETVGESHRRVRAASQRALNIKYANHQGLDLVYPETLGATDLALGALRLIRGAPLSYIKAAFDAYWTDHRDLDDQVVVERLIRRCVPDQDLDLNKAPGALQVAQEEAEDAGIVGAPAYVIDGQIFVGREHLPWVEEIVRDQL